MLKSFSKKKMDLSLIFFVFLSIVICCEAYKLDLGDFHAPKSGLFPFFLGTLMGILSLAKISVNLFSGSSNDIDIISIPVKRMSLLIGAILAYIVLMEKLGFIVSTFFYVFFLMRAVESKRWLIAIMIAVLIATCTYLIFDYILNVQLPRNNLI
jgi:putative tricarboxylic transport membrane protein